jgi:alkaline phosphatase
MKTITVITMYWFSSIIGLAQLAEYGTTSVFSHNDYVQPIPFYNAYFNEVGFIEADVFLVDDRLLVAHTFQEIDKKNTLDSLYLIPLQRKILTNSGYAYPNRQKSLTLMIDLKTEGTRTLRSLVKTLNRYQGLINAKNLEVVVSGNVPDSSQWDEFPSFIHFDGRPGKDYTAQQLTRISLISTAFTDYSRWNGKGLIPKAETEKILALKNETKLVGKKLRFWATPDFTNSWIQLMKLKIDVIGTDRVSELISHLNSFPTQSFINETFHTPYKPTHHHNRLGRPKNIILLVGDGNGLTQIFSGYTANKGELNLFGIKDIGFSLTASADSYITDSAAGATAMATGAKTNNRFIGVDSTRKNLTLLTDILKQRRFKTAIISNGDVTDATPAAFYAHQPERSLSDAIALDFLTTPSDILLGAGQTVFSNRSDKRRLLEELTKNGYRTSNRFDAIDSIKGTKIAIIDDRVGMSKKQGRGDFLERSLKRSLALFSQERNPFFIMLEGAQIDWGGHNNDLEYVVREELDFDKVVGQALKFADENRETLVIVTADHETGGLSLLDGNLKTGFVYGKFSSNDHTAVMVPVFSYGPGSALFTGVYSNTEIFEKIIQLTSLKK